MKIEKNQTKLHKKDNNPKTPQNQPSIQFPISSQDTFQKLKSTTFSDPTSLLYHM